MAIDQTGLLQFLNWIGIIFFLWLFYLVPSIFIAGPVMFFTRKRVEWNLWDFAMFILPYSIWIFLIIAHGKGKGIGNMLESLMIGCIVPISPVTRSLVRDKLNQENLAIGLLIFLCLIAIGVWAFTPAFPE
jgi:hypothetical protein